MIYFKMFGCILLHLKRGEGGEDIVDFSNIQNMLNKMKSRITQVAKVSQGSDNPGSPWAKARFCFMKQLAIWFGMLDPTKVLHSDFPNQNKNANANANLGKFHIVDIF